MLRKLLTTVAFSLFLFPGYLFAQGTLTGTVTSQTGEELAGANIYLTELERGTSTDIDGNYDITGIPYGTYTIRTTFVGFKKINEQVTIDSETVTYDIQLKEDLVGLDELVVTGQGGAALEKKRLSTTVESINQEQLEAIPAQRLDQVLQANLPGAQVRLTSGQPGTASIIRGRGITSANTNTTPVIYVDGVRVDNTTGFAAGIGTGGAQSSALNDIPIENIERVEFIKGGAATTLYGSDAANGVIQIFTKKGTKGNTRFTFETQVGATVGTEDFLFFDETADILFDPGFYQNHSLSASGGTEGLTYSFSGSLSDDNGFRPNNSQLRRSIRGTVSADIYDWVKYTGSIGFVNNEFQRDFNANTSFATFGELETGPGFFGSQALDQLSQGGLDSLQNRVDRIQDAVDFRSVTNRFQTSHKLDFTMTNNWTASATVGLDSRATRDEQPVTNEFLVAIGAVVPGTTDQGDFTAFERDFLALTVEANTTYRADFGDFSSVSVVGGQFFRDDDRQINANAPGVPDGVTTINSGTDVTATDFRRTVANFGVFAQENFGFKDRYFIEAGIRIDGNSAFGDEVGAQVFPKVGVSYSVSDEPFFQDNIPSSVISSLKLRANYGEAGNFPTPFANLALANINPFLGVATIERGGSPGNDELVPERITTLEFGTNLGLINDRISIEATYFDQTTEDALFNVGLAPSSGFFNQLTNIGEVSNKGFEIATNFVLLRSEDYGLRVNASVNTLTNEVVDGGAPFNVGGFAFLGAFVDEGQPIGFLRGNRATFDEDGNVTNVEPNAVLGSPTPDVSGTFGLNFNYKGLTFTGTGDYQQGAQGVNVDQVLRGFNGIGEDPTRGGNFFTASNVFVEDTDFIKIRLLALSYRLPNDWFDDTLRRVEVGFSAVNPFNFFSSTFDPEVTGAGIGTQNATGVGGFGFSTASAPRQYIGSLKIGF